MKSLTRYLLPGVAASALLLSQAAVVTAPATAAAASSCVPATSVEAIIDDSHSMTTSDPNKLRVQATNILISSLDPSTTLGAVEFGSQADTVFAPAAVGPNASSMSDALRVIRGDNGVTNYTAAFARADADNPGSTARIFLTDGGAKDSTPQDHLNHNVPTYVIGFSPDLSSPADQAKLQKIASDTGGTYTALSNASGLQSTMNNIVASLTCAAPPTLFKNTLKSGHKTVRRVKLAKGTRTARVALTWSNPANRYSVTDMRLKVGNKIVAINPQGSHRVPKLKLKVTHGKTFLLVKVKNLSRFLSRHNGRLIITIRADRVVSGTKPPVLTTQVTHGK